MYTCKNKSRKEKLIKLQYYLELNFHLTTFLLKQGVVSLIILYNLIMATNIR